MTPFLKWAGGKRWLAKHLAGLVPEGFNRYIEPFLGSGAIYFELLPKAAILSDANEALIETYKAVRDYPLCIAERLSELHDAHDADVYYAMRSSSPDNPIEIAVRFIYLNRTCWNGLYRVNRKNQFNVPI
jgi:DNA adenine methylase